MISGLPAANIIRNGLVAENTPTQIPTENPGYLRRRMREPRAPRQEVIDELKRWSMMRETSGGSRPSPFYGNWFVSQETKAEVLWELSTGRSSIFLDLMEYFTPAAVVAGFDIDLPTGEQLIQVQQLCGETASRIRQVVTTNDFASPHHKEMSQTVMSYGEVERLMPGVGELDAVSRRFVSATERITSFLATSDMINWATDLSSPFCWRANARSGTLSSFHDARLGPPEFVAFRIYATSDETNRAENRSKWEFSEPKLVQGVLGLWLYTLAKRRAALLSFIPLLHNQTELQQLDLYRELSSFKRDDRCMRIIASARGTQSNEVGAWLGGHRTGRIWRPDGTARIMIPNEDSRFLGPIFGLYVSSMSRDKPGGENSTPPEMRDKSNGSDGDEDVCIMHRPGLNIELQCAQELFSHFMLAAASRVSEVGGATRVAPGLELPDAHVNTVFTVIANEAVDAGIARDLDEAYILILPAFAYYGLLPEDSGGKTIKFENGERKEVD
jgi:hypothetical protein